MVLSVCLCFNVIVPTNRVCVYVHTYNFNRPNKQGLCVCMHNCNRPNKQGLCVCVFPTAVVETFVGCVLVCMCMYYICITYESCFNELVFYLRVYIPLQLSQLTRVMSMFVYVRMYLVKLYQPTWVGVCVCICVFMRVCPVVEVCWSTTNHHKGK